MARRRLGELLLEQGAVTREQLEAALAYQRQSGNRLGAALVEQGVLTEEKLTSALAAALGLEVVHLAEAEVEWAALHALRDRFCEANDLFPVSLDASKARKVLTVAMSDPLNLPAIEEIEFTTGCKVQPKLATLSEVRTAIRRHYHRQAPDDARRKEAPPSPPASAPVPGLTLSPSASGNAAKRIQIDSTAPFPGLTPSQSQLSYAARPASRGTPAVPPPARPPVEPPAPAPEPEVTARTALADLIRAREEAQQLRATSAVQSDLEYLTGEPLQPPGPQEQLERLERQLWALMRIMAKKGLLTREEFLAEFDD
jgi:hypothetical protein